MRPLFFLLLFSFIFIQCDKDQVSIDKDCIPHEMLANGYGDPIFKPIFPQNAMAYFNPNNSDEIIYGHVDGISPIVYLMKYNLVTKEKQIIYQGNLTRRPRWGKNGWILLNIKDSLGYNIYKIKDDGNEITPLTTSGNCFDPEWNITSDKFTYKFAFTTPTKFILSDEEGLFIDTIPCGGGSFSSWQHPIYTAGSSMNGMEIYNPLNCETIFSYGIEALAQSANGAEWLDEDNVFWCHTTGIYTTNIVTRETQVIRETCNASCYQRPTYARDINKIIVEKQERVLDTETSGRAIISLVMMNPDGTDEEVIEIE